MSKVSAADITRVKAMGFLHNRGTEDEFSGRVVTENGTLTADQLCCVHEVAKKFGSGTVAFTTRLTLEIPGIHYGDIPAVQEYLAREGLVTGGTGAKVRPVVSCKGTVCQYGNADTQGLARRIHKAFFEGYGDVKLPHKFKIAVGGCPNNCVKPSLNDVGITALNAPLYNPDKCAGCGKCGVEAACPMGAAKLTDGKLAIDPARCNSCGRCVSKCYREAMEGGRRCFRVFIGGRWGKEIQRGAALSRTYSEEELFPLIEKVILFYREQGKPGERLGTLVQRVGLEAVEAALSGDGLLARKQEILARELVK